MQKKAKAKKPARRTVREANPHVLYALDPSTGAKIALAFGFYDNAPTMALFVGDSVDPVALIPRTFMEIALKQGWSD